MDVNVKRAVKILNELALRLPRRLRLVIESDHREAGEQRLVVLRFGGVAILAVDVDEGGFHMSLIRFHCYVMRIL